ncbi:hypothetical protein FHT02_000595 [Sphingomonas xinjiangensis]|uniref:Uncharacterized protein n=1 Tax=Sphingomonas xinjiangensis TaxID=643568 RepID=A0A840YBJ0_9SPHN|nr:hypothetical protein [Sphingomonas xinjiangensis]
MCGHLRQGSACEAQALRALRDDTAGARRESSAQVSGSSLRNAVKDWRGHRAASAKMRQNMAEQIEREKHLRYSHL